MVEHKFVNFTCTILVTENGGFITVMITVQMSGKVTMRTCHKGPDRDVMSISGPVCRVTKWSSVNTQVPEFDSTRYL